MPAPTDSAAANAAARERILTRLRQGMAAVPARPEVLELDEDWLRRQPPLGDPAERFLREQQSVGSQVLRVPTWEALPAAVAPWFREHGIASAITGRVERLTPLRRHLAELGVTVRTYDKPLEQQRGEVFGTDCGITTSAGGIAETGSIILVPGPEEPRLLSLAVPIHLALVERARLHATLGDFIRSGAYQRAVPTNLVLVSGASRTADIELTLAVGVHGPRLLLVALIG